MFFLGENNLRVFLEFSVFFRKENAVILAYFHFFSFLSSVHFFVFFLYVLWLRILLHDDSGGWQLCWQRGSFLDDSCNFSLLLISSYCHRVEYLVSFINHNIHSLHLHCAWLQVVE